MLIEIWEDDEDFEGGAGITAAPAHLCKDMMEKGLIRPKAKLLTQYEAKTWLEAMQMKNKFFGWEEYKPSILENGEIDPVYLEDLGGEDKDRKHSDNAEPRSRKDKPRPGCRVDRRGRASGESDDAAHRLVSSPPRNLRQSPYTHAELNSDRGRGHSG